MENNNFLNKKLVSFTMTICDDNDDNDRTPMVFGDILVYILDDSFIMHGCW